MRIQPESIVHTVPVGEEVLLFLDSGTVIRISRIGSLVGAFELPEETDLEPWLAKSASVEKRRREALEQRTAQADTAGRRRGARVVNRGLEDDY